MLCAASRTEPRYWANSGGPSSRTRVEHISSSLLGRGDGPILCPRHLCLALDFGEHDPVTTTYRLLSRLGYSSPEAMRYVFAQDISPMVCQPNPSLGPLVVATAKPMDVLRQAFLLGLCTIVRFDPDRPVLWTQASLLRRLELFDVTEFYA